MKLLKSPKALNSRVLRREWGNGLSDFRDYYLGLYKDYYRDPFPHSLLSTKSSPRFTYRGLVGSKGTDFRGSTFHRSLLGPNEFRVWGSSTRVEILVFQHRTCTRSRFWHSTSP